MRLAAILAATALTIQPTVARAEESSCLTSKQAGSLAGYALPSVISGAAKRCSATLTDTSFLKTDGPALAERYAARKDATWPAAKTAFLAMSKGNEGAGKIFSSLPDSSLREMVDVVFEGMVAQQIPVDDCDKIDNFVRILAPLPPKNTAELVVLLIGLSTASKSEKPGKLAICKS